MSEFDFISVTNIRLTLPDHLGGDTVQEIAFGQWFDIEADVEPSNAGSSDPAQRRFTSDDIEWTITEGHTPADNPIARITTDANNKMRRLEIRRAGSFTLRAYIRHGKAEIMNPLD